MADYNNKDVNKTKHLDENIYLWPFTKGKPKKGEGGGKSERYIVPLMIKFLQFR